MIYPKPYCARFRQRDEFGGNIGNCRHTSFFQFNRALDKPGRARTSITLSGYDHIGILNDQVKGCITFFIRICRLSSMRFIKLYDFGTWKPL
jgi:hypothetical protein